MSYESRAYDDPNTDGFPADPVVVLVVRGTHDISRLLHALNRGNVETTQLASQIASQCKRHNSGRAALRLLRDHGGADFTSEAAS